MFAILKARLRTSLYGFEQTRLAPFVLRVTGNWLGEDLRLDGLKTIEEPTYRTLAGTWKTTDLDELRSALVQACELHIERSGDHTNRETFEFWEQASQLYAAEVLLVPGLRRALGLASPSVEHPLLRGPLGRVVGRRRRGHEPRVEPGRRGYLSRRALHEDSNGGASGRR
jgi:hypothetical protein